MWGEHVYTAVFKVALMVKNPPTGAGGIRSMGLIPGSGNPLEEGIATHSVFLPRDPMDRGAWWATVHGVAKSRTGLKRLSTHLA